MNVHPQDLAQRSHTRIMNVTCCVPSCLSHTICHQCAPNGSGAWNTETQRRTLCSNYSTMGILSGVDSAVNAVVKSVNLIKSVKC